MPYKDKEKIAKWKQENPEAVKRHNQTHEAKRIRTARERKNIRLKADYGITLAEYEQRLEAQQGRCAICRGDNGGKSLAVDHDHKSGKVRGLLCDNCNRMLGSGRDNPRILAEGIRYLEYHNA